MEAKTLLRLIKKDLSHLEEIMGAINQELPLLPEEVELALVRANALLRELEILNKLAGKNGVGSGASGLNDDTLGVSSEFGHDPGEQTGLTGTESGDDSKPAKCANKIELVDIEQAVPVNKESAKPVEVKTSDISYVREELLREDDTKGMKSPGEIQGESHQLVNDILSADKSDSEYQMISIDSIKASIGINDRFLFIRELFENSSEQFEAAISALDSLENIRDAVNYLKINFKWHKTEASQKFLVLVKRRFTK